MNITSVICSHLMREESSAPVNIENLRLGSHSDMSDKLNSSKSVSEQNFSHDTSPTPAPAPPPPACCCRDA